MLDNIEKRQKEFLAMEKRYYEINDEIRRIPWIKLDKPIHDGWDITIQLREEERRSKDGEFMAAAVDICSSSRTHPLRRGGQLIADIRRNPSFPHCRQYFMHTNAEGILIYHGPHLDRLTEKEYAKITNPRISKWFEKREKEVVQRWGGQVWRYNYYVCTIPDYMLVMHVKKRMLTQEKDIDPKLLKEKAFLEDKLEEHWREEGGHRWWKDEVVTKNRRHTKDALRHVIKGELDEVDNYHKLNKHK